MNDGARVQQEHRTSRHMTGKRQFPFQTPNRLAPYPDDLMSLVACVPVTDKVYLKDGSAHTVPHILPR